MRLGLGYLPAPLTFCAAVAARTRRARIGTAVVVSPLVPAVALAEQATVAGLLWIDPDPMAPYLAGLADADPPARPRVGGLANVFLADDPDRGRESGLRAGHA